MDYHAPEPMENDRHPSGWQSLAAAIAEDAIRCHDSHCIESRAFDYLLDAAGVNVSPGQCREALRRRGVLP